MGEGVPLHFGTGYQQPPRTVDAALLGVGELGATWAGTLEDGTKVAAKLLRECAIPAPLSQVGRLGPSSSKALTPVIRLERRADEQWVFSELETGVPLGTLLTRGRMAPMCAVAVAMSALDALATLHQVGLWHGALHAGNVHVDRQGWVRLGDYCLTPRGSLSDGQLRAADIQAVGVLLCGMLGVPVRPRKRSAAPSSPNSARAQLVELARRISVGPLQKRQNPYAAVDARLALWETAGRLATRRNQSLAKQRLAELVIGPKPHAPPAYERRTAPERLAAPRPEPQRPLGRLVAGLTAAVVAISVSAGLPGLVGFVLSHQARPAAPPVYSAAVRNALPLQAVPHRFPDGGNEVTPAAPKTPSLPTLAPAAAGQVSGVLLHLLESTCSAGAACPVHLEVWLQPSGRQQRVSWTFKSVQPCGGTPVDLGGGSLTAQPGWNHVVSETSLLLPVVTSQAILAVSGLPDQAASAPVIVGEPPATC